MLMLWFRSLDLFLVALKKLMLVFAFVCTSVWLGLCAWLRELPIPNLSFSYRSKTGKKCELF